MVGASLDATTATATATAKLFHHHHHHRFKPSSSAIKFLCSYGGMIIPRYSDGKLRYHGGETRVLSVDRATSFSEILLKMGELCGAPVNLRCQLPADDLDALVSITSHEDLANLIEEYDRAATATGSLKIRAFLSPPKKTSLFSSPQPQLPLSASSSSSTRSSSSSSSSSSPSTMAVPGSIPRCYRQISKPVAYPVKRIPGYGYHAHGNPTHICLVHNGNHWQ